MRFTSINPYTSEKLAEYLAHTDIQAESRLHIADRAFADWSRCSFSQRANCFQRLADVLRCKQGELALLMTGEMGKILAESRAGIKKCAVQCLYYADHAEAMLRPDDIATEAQYSGVSYEPVGIVLAIMPWNFPFWQVFRYAAPALMAGNVTLLKPAPSVPGCGLAIEQASREAGFPEGVMACLLIDVPELIAVIADDLVFQEETFGPVAVITVVRSADEAIQYANRSKYRLSAALWTVDTDRAAYLARQLKVGSVFVNAKVRSDNRLPIGGVKKSGYGRELGTAGIREFCATKTIYIA